MRESLTHYRFSVIAASPELTEEHRPLYRRDAEVR